jgi:DNA-binding SARP family transcriptional activator
MSKSLHIKLFGEFYLASDGLPIHGVKSERLQALLAFMLLHWNAPQTRQQVAVHLWPDAIEGDAKANLRRRLHELKQLIPDADRWLRVETKTIQWLLTEHCFVDVVQFETAITQSQSAQSESAQSQQALEQAATLYQGDLMPSCYDDWIVPYREQLRQQAIAGLDTLVTLLTTQGDHRPAIRYAQQLQRALHNSAMN